MVTYILVLFGEDAILERETHYSLNHLKCAIFHRVLVYYDNPICEIKSHQN